MLQTDLEGCHSGVDIPYLEITESKHTSWLEERRVHFENLSKGGYRLMPASQFTAHLPELNQQEVVVSRGAQLQPLFRALKRFLREVTSAVQNREVRESRHRGLSLDRI